MKTATYSINLTDSDAAPDYAAEAARLIKRSASHTEIVTAEWSDGLATELLVECDDSNDTLDGTIEYWGTDEDGDEWHVHLTGQPTE